MGQRPTTGMLRVANPQRQKGSQAGMPAAWACGSGGALGVRPGGVGLECDNGRRGSRGYLREVGGGNYLTTSKLHKSEHYLVCHKGTQKFQDIKISPHNFCFYSYGYFIKKDSSGRGTPHGGEGE